MKQFNKNKELKRLRIKQNKNTYIKRISIVISCFILLIGIIMFTFAKFENSSPEFTLINGKVVSGSKDVNVIAIYKGTEQVNEIPARGSGWLFDRAECTNGATIEWNYDGWGPDIRNLTTKTKCSLYFKQGQIAVDYLNSIAPTTDSLLTDGTTDNNLRYIGTNPNNYVSFNNELWRIIGVMNNIENSIGQVQSLVKIRRAESLGNYSWDSSASGVNTGYGINEWSQADLMQELNNDYLGNVTIGTDGKWYNSSNNSKTTAKPSTTISSEAQNKIENVKWNLGSPSNNAGSFDSSWASVTSSTAYIRERSNYTGKVCTSGTQCNDTVTRTSSWTGKVGLFYPSDYLYATSGGNATNRQTCLGLGMYTDWSNSSYANCKDNDWLKPASGSTWTLSPGASSSANYSVNRVDSSGYVSGNGAVFANGVSPVIFLKSTISITGGEGTSTNPYTLE